MSYGEEVKHLHKIMQDISMATIGFEGAKLIAKSINTNSGFGKVYKSVSEEVGLIAVRRLDRGQGQGDHENIVSLLGFCDEDDEKILVYKYESNGSLDKYLNNEDLILI